MIFISNHSNFTQGIGDHETINDLYDFYFNISSLGNFFIIFVTIYWYLRSNYHYVDLLCKSSLMTYLPNTSFSQEDRDEKLLCIRDYS